LVTVRERFARRRRTLATGVVPAAHLWKSERVESAKLAGCRFEEPGYPPRAASQPDRGASQERSD
jgi:hypothetical protein